MPPAFRHLSRHEVSKRNRREWLLHLVSTPIAAQAGSENVVWSVRSSIALCNQVFRSGLKPLRLRPQCLMLNRRGSFPHLAPAVTASAVLIAKSGHSNLLESGCHASSLCGSIEPGSASAFGRDMAAGLIARASCILMELQPAFRMSGILFEGIRTDKCVNHDWL